STLWGRLTDRITWSFATFAARMLFSIGVSTLFVALFFIIFSPVRHRPAEVFTGALGTAFLLCLMRPAFSHIIRFRPNYGFAFGSLKAVFVVTVWVYYVFVALLFGAELIACMQRRDSLLLRRLFLKPSKHLLADEGPLAHFIRIYDENEVVVREGEPGDEMFYILSGRVRVERAGLPIGSLEAGQYFGEMSMLLDQPRTATVRTLTPETKLVVISRQNFDAILAENPEIVRKLLVDMATRVKDTTAGLSNG
ncbi:MAG: cyclic nucleotide-binding domain-containing protein, partial [Kiritimatiellae bacterium]|nr:cyclic nucleotide-binding domain-containing protein [Kiritimatiellia bacterium]